MSQTGFLFPNLLFYLYAIFKNIPIKKLVCRNNHKSCSFFVLEWLYENKRSSIIGFKFF